MRISVALCSYNGEKFLDPQLESVARQTRLPDELVICDDGSTDGTGGLVEAFSKTASFPTRFVSNPKNLGVSKNFEQAISLCDGDVIVTADQDDVWFPHKLATIEAAFRSNPGVGLVFSDADLIDDEGQSLGARLWPTVRFDGSLRRQIARRDPFLTLLKRPVITGATMAFRSGFRSILLPIAPGWVHDEWIGLMIAGVSNLKAIPEPLMQYRRHSNNQIGVIGLNVAERTRASLNRSQACLLDRAMAFEQLRAAVAERVPDRPDLLVALDQKVAHDRARGSLPRSRFRRIPRILRELGSSRYSRYSGTVLSSLKDLLSGS